MNFSECIVSISPYSLSLNPISSSAPSGQVDPAAHLRRRLAEQDDDEGEDGHLPHAAKVPGDRDVRVAIQ